MSLTACTIQQISPTDNPNEGRVKINHNFECIGNTIATMQIDTNTGSTIVDASSNINVSLTYSGTTPIYSVGVVNNPIFSSLSSTTISTDGLTLNSIGSNYAVLTLGLDSLGNVVSSKTATESYWISGSSGIFSIKADNDSGVDATNDYASAKGYNTRSNGYSSHSEGANTTTIGIASHSEGSGTTAFGSFSHSEGSFTTSSGSASHAEGYLTTAIGLYSHAEGDNTRAVGKSSHTEGSGTTSIGIFSHAEGYRTTASGQSSHSEGYLSSALSNYSHAEGYYATTLGIGSHAEGGDPSLGPTNGRGGTALGVSSHAEGLRTRSVGNYSHSEGQTTISSGQSAHSEGRSTIAIGDYSHSEGFNTTASGGASHAEGFETESIGSVSHAEGQYTTAIGNFSHSEGVATQAVGQGSHAEGAYTTSIGIYSHSQGSGTTAVGIYSHAGGAGSIASGSTSFVYSRNSLVTGERSVILGGENITGVTADTVYVPKLNIKSISTGTSIAMLGINSGGFVVSGETLSPMNTGRVLFVSTAGNDNNAEVGNLDKSWRNIYSAKSASTSGDTICILPGTWTYDNRNSFGNPYNGQIESKVNLWKNGITYYFMPGSKVVFYNQTVSGQIMYLFNPGSTSGETCTVLGDLEWEGKSFGLDSSNGHATFFWADNTNDSGFTFYAKFKKLTSYSCEAIRVSRGTTLEDSKIADITLNGEEIYREYIEGQSGAAATEFVNGSSSVLKYKSHIKRRYNIGSNFWYFQVGGNLTKSYFEVYGDYLLNSSSSRTFLLRDLSGNININITNINHGPGNVFETIGTGGWILNLKGDINDYTPNNSSTNGVFWITSNGNTINYNGNITTNIGSGNGRYIAGGTNNNTYNINGDITYLGTGVTTNFAFYTQNNGVVNYVGKITGNYAGGLAQTLNGEININNSYIKSIVENSSSRLFFNGTTGQGSFRLNNSYVELKNNTNAISNGAYINSIINNSIIINTGSGNTLSNTTNFGKLQVLNSTIISSHSGATTILSTGTTSVIASNTTVNTPYNISDLKGSITVLTDLIY